MGFIPFLSAQKANDGSRYAENSVLSTGKWIQMKVKENGIFKLTYDEIKKQGINDPSKVKIYGYGGWMLSEDFSTQYVDDLPEVPVYIEKGGDGVFSSGDYLLFYARGTIKWTYNSSRGTFEHENNPYSTYGSYFITESDAGPKEMDKLPTQDISSTPLHITTFDDYVLHEKDSVSILYSGRELYGENFVRNSGNQSFTFEIPGITSDPGKARLSFAAAPNVTTPVKMSIGGQDIINLSVSNPGNYYVKAKQADGWGDWIGEKNQRVTATVTYNSSGQTVAFLNFIVLNIKRSLQFYSSAYTFFRSVENRSNPVTYSVGEATASRQVWEVTQNNDTRMVQTEIKNGRMEFSIPSSGNTLREFVMIDLNGSFLVPEFANEIENQNLHALPPADMIILVPEIFVNQAERLAERHRQQSGLRVTVVNDRLVFNEFSSGTPDATAYRRFMKMFYDRAVSGSESDKPKYLLLFGDGLFDNRFLTRESKNVDQKFYLLTYQVRESLDGQSSYGTDDYFGFLDDNEGQNISSGVLDLGIGRFPVSSVTQAEDAVNKVLNYMDNKQFGNWKTKLIFTADNTDDYTTTNFAVHVGQADELARYIEQNNPEYMVYKYYLDAYRLVNVNGKFVSPDAKNALLNQLKEGCFLLNYTGHGSVTDWTSEGLLNITDVRQMNFENLPLWITATCDFGWFDGFNTSGGETAFLNKKSGAIALFTTSRVVGSDANSKLNKQFIRYLFTKSEVDGKNLRLGDIFRFSKRQMGSDSNKLNFILLGDPALVLNYPEWSIKLETINGKAVSENETISLKALDKVAIAGVITDESGNRADDFSGTMNASVFDSKQTMESVSVNTEGGRFTYTDYPGMIYSGKTDVKNGAFNFTFNVPLDISYEESNGKLGMYAFDSSIKKDAFGSFTGYSLSGTNDDVENNGIGPEIIKMFLNTEDFKDGGSVNETPFFYAEVRDESGINLAGSGIGHDIMIMIDNNPVWTYYPLNSYYYALDDTRGIVGFSIPELPAGKHSLTFKIWNIFNNSTVDTLNFNVVKGHKPNIIDLHARENPARDITYFTLSYDLPETVLNIEIGVFDVTGRLIWTHKEKGSSGYLEHYPIEWNLVNNKGTRVPPGIYVYRATVCTSTSSETTKAKKIIVLGQ